MKSNRKKLKDAILKYSQIQIEKYSENTYSNDYKHPKTGKKCTWSEACDYKNTQLKKILDTFYPHE